MEHTTSTSTSTSTSPWKIPTGRHKKEERTNGSHASLPQIRIDDGGPPLAPGEARSLPRTAGQKEPPPFRGITLEIPTGGLSDDIPTGNMEFSKRGSMLLDGKKVSGGGEASLSPGATNRRSRSSPSLRESAPPKALSRDEEMLSQKVRSFYDIGTDDLDSPTAATSVGRVMGTRWQHTLDGIDQRSFTSVSRDTSASDLHDDGASTASMYTRPQSIIQREEQELAGGVEDWQDVNVADVDRYGFIITRTTTATTNGTTGSGVDRSPTVKDPRSLQRVATSLHLAADTPRRHRSIRRTPSSAHGPRTNSARVSRQPSVLSSPRPTSSPATPPPPPVSGVRHWAHRLPYNTTRRLMDEAGDMLTMPPVGSGMPAEQQQTLLDDRARRKEVEREEKWRKMARVVPTGAVGGGMIFDFDTHDPKLIERTWKGIPDRWRATAWYSFLATSARRQAGSRTDDQLTHAFHTSQQHSSPDDAQIDIDVPRTISSHIMFRRRYRGGQRLLFRVLHAMSLQFPSTGYVQGMAALAATLLAYYEEERAFVMLVRLWDLRGLDRLYQAGFGGLMAALKDFEQQWLGGGELAAKLTSLGIDPTAYGTKWYLTLFNYSLPFSAQLRVWDVFMLLGDDDLLPSPTALDGTPGFGSTLDVLHATAAALIDGMRDILLVSDFENAMKTLTSWIPIRDDDLFLRVTKAEWTVHRRRRG